MRVGPSASTVGAATVLVDGGASSVGITSVAVSVAVAVTDGSVVTASVVATIIAVGSSTGANPALSPLLQATKNNANITNNPDTYFLFIINSFIVKFWQWCGHDEN
jgi:hypothetical protein